MTPTEIQHALNVLGFGPLTEDGIIGPLSKAAVKRFQSNNPPLAVDGDPGSQTQAMLMVKLANLPKIPGTSSATVMTADVSPGPKAIPGLGSIGSLFGGGAPKPVAGTPAGNLASAMGAPVASPVASISKAVAGTSTLVKVGLVALVGTAIAIALKRSSPKGAPAAAKAA